MRAFAPMTIRRLVLAVLGVVALGGSAGSASAACTEGVHPFHGVQARTFCGAAHATLKFGGASKSYSGGECALSLGTYTVNIGTIVLGQTSAHHPDYLGIDIPGGKKDGTVTHAVIAGVRNGHSFSLGDDSITTSHHGTLITFTGTALTGGGATISGTVHCH